MAKISEIIKKIPGKIQNEKGVSLVELVVAVAIFSLVVTIASGIFINAIKAQKMIIAKQNVASDLRYSADFMLKELRMAQAHPTDVTLTFSDGNGNQLNAGTTPSSSTLSFYNSNGDNIVYALSGTEIKRSNLTTATLTDDDQSVSSTGVQITGLSFILNDWDLTRGVATSTAPLITFVIRARAASGTGGEAEFQTSVSPRIY